MIQRTNPDGSVTWIPLDPANTDYQAELVDRIKAEKFKTDEAFYDALKAEADKVQAETDENQTKRAEHNANAKSAEDALLTAKLKAVLKTLTSEEIARIIR
jgi:hypothetical protein